MRRVLFLTVLIFSSVTWAGTFAQDFEKVGQKIDKLQANGEQLQKQADQELEKASKNIKAKVKPWSQRLATACQDIGVGFEKAWHEIKGE